MAKELGERNREGSNWMGRSPVPQLSAGTARSASTAPPPSLTAEPLPAASSSAAAAAAAAASAAAAAAATTGRAGVHPGAGRTARAGVPRERVRSPASGAPTRRPYLPLAASGRAQGVGEGAGGWGGRAALRGKKEENPEERTVPGEKPAPAAAASPSLLPAPRARRWRLQLPRGSARFFSSAPRHPSSGPATSRRRRRRHGGRWVNGCPQPRSQAAAGPAFPTRRDEGAGPPVPNHGVPPAGSTPCAPAFAPAAGSSRQPRLER